MINKFDAKCPYCETEFHIEFENEDDELVYCPSCGEQLPDFEEDAPYEEDWD
jgi:Zn ribbon nucleic-acid-binding protein